MSKENITLEQARQAKQKVIRILSESHVVQDAGVGIAATASGYSVKVHLSDSLPKGFHLPKSITVKGESAQDTLEVPVNAEVVGKAYTF